MVHLDMYKRSSNYATLSKYPLETALIDTFWGTFAMGTARVRFFNLTQNSTAPIECVL